MFSLWRTQLTLQSFMFLLFKISKGIVWVIKNILTKEILDLFMKYIRVKIEHYILMYVIMYGLTSNLTFCV